MAFKVRNKIIAAGGIDISGSPFTVSGQSVTLGGGTVTVEDGLTVSGSGVTVSKGAVTMADGLTISGSGITLSGTGRKQKDVFIAPYMFGGTASTMASGTAASLTGIDCLGGCWPCIRFAHEGSTCPVFAVVGAPLDADTTASATVWVDWASGSANNTNDNVAVWGACVYYLMSGSLPSEWTFAGSGQKAASIVDTSGCVMGSASIADFNAITGCPIGVRIWHNSAVGASDGSGSNTVLLGVRLRYYSVGLGR